MLGIFMSINRGTDKDDEAHIYNGILLSHKRNVICKDIDGLQTVIKTEASQKKKTKYYRYTTSFLTIKKEVTMPTKVWIFIYFVALILIKEDAIEVEILLNTKSSQQ